MKSKLLLALILLSSSFAYGVVPHQISYQGALKDSTGVPVADGVYSIKFRIYNDSLSGNILWETPGYVPIQTVNGLFQHNLGSRNPIPDSINQFPNLWVGITVNLESEMLPRTRLISVPFSLASQFTDTARVSLDRTINAGDLIMGTLDTTRFSAYQDLISENKIGAGPDQVAAGNHVHPGVSGSIMRLEDTTWTYTFIDNNQDVLLRSFIVPHNLIDKFLRVTYGAKASCSSVNVDVKVKINGFMIDMHNISCNSAFSAALSFIKLNGNNWAVASAEISINPDSDLVIEFYGHVGYAVSVGIYLGNIIAEYDMD